MGDHGRAMNRMGWTIALAGAWTLSAVAVAGTSGQGGRPTTNCLPGFYLSGGWCVIDPQPADQPNPPADVMLVMSTSVGRLGIELRTEGL